MLKNLLSRHLENYPHMQAIDIVKLVFQAYRGCGHLLGPEELVTQRITAECEQLQPDALQPLTDPLGERYIRINLRRAMHEHIQPVWIARMMKLSCIEPPFGSIDDVIATTTQLANGDERVIAALQPMLEDHEWLPSHSPEYHAHYAPAYRVIDKRFAPMLTVLSAAGKADQEHMIIGIDGRCGSGKSTLAGLLSDVLQCQVVRMDDFITPHAEKTPERLALPGGNADIVRFCDEVILPLLNTGKAAYRPYSCQEDRFIEPLTVSKDKYLIIEGSYCLHPDTQCPYDVRVFMTVPYEEQKRRILARSGEWMLHRFVKEWIPLEEAYFRAFHLPDERCIVLDQPDQL